MRWLLDLLNSDNRQSSERGRQCPPHHVLLLINGCVSSGPNDQANPVEAVTLIKVTLARVRDLAMVCGKESPAPLTLLIKINLKVHVVHFFKCPPRKH